MACFRGSTLRYTVIRDLEGSWDSAARSFADPGDREMNGKGPGEHAMLFGSTQRDKDGCTQYIHRVLLHCVYVCVAIKCAYFLFVFVSSPAIFFSFSHVTSNQSESYALS